MPVKKVVVTQEVADSILTYSRSAYPREGILLLRGKTKNGVVTVDSVVIPPMATHGEGFSGFSWWLLPIDMTYVGVAHSHPSGYAVPSHQDMLHVTGRIMMIAGYPYDGVECIKVYDVHGQPVPLEVGAHQS